MNNKAAMQTLDKTQPSFMNRESVGEHGGYRLPAELDMSYSQVLDK